MAKKKSTKRRDSSDNDSDMEFSAKGEGGNINVEFDFRNVSEDDYHGVKGLISQISHGALASFVQVADLVCGQANIGCVVTTEGGDSGVCAMGTILNINQHRSNPGMATFRKQLADIAKRNPKSSRWITEMLAGSPSAVTGLLLKERLINFPPELVTSVHKVLIDDVNWSCSSEYELEEGETKMDYCFSHLLFLSTFEVESFGGSSGNVDIEAAEDTTNAAVPVEGGMKRKRKLERKAMEASRMYHHWEDEVFIERSLFSHTWQNTSKSTVVRAGKKYVPYNILYAVRWEDYVGLVGQLGNMN